MLRRRRGLAAESIVETLELVGAREVSIHELKALTRLPEPTLRDNIRALQRQFVIDIRRDEKRIMWLRLKHPRGKPAQD